MSGAAGSGAGGGAPQGLIGPNAILQLAAVLEAAGGLPLRDRLLKAAGIMALPSGEEMVDEAPVARLHQALRAELPDSAQGLAWEAGLRTADYIMAHRIPRAAQHLLRALPPRAAGWVLTRAIEKNAWTFAGSGRFVVLAPGVFELRENPVVRGEHSDVPVCHWHAAVFERLFGRLVASGSRCIETRCSASGAEACRFELGRGAVAAGGYSAARWISAPSRSSIRRPS